MASSIISKIVASAASIQNDFSLAAANLNLDFTLIKLEAPKEFTSVGTSLSNVRKEDAERGSLHRTARKLGALFEGVAPPPQQLLSAYGKRVSEICEKRHIDTEERNRYGLFSQFAGTDSASLWAAATSGTSAISVHLLACMIAGLFDSAQSVALWLQLVETRKSEIQDTINQETDQVKVIAKALVTQQEFTRDELAAWDNSARSWIDTAHLATAEQRRVALLYADNSGMPVNTSSDPYNSVITAWKDAMTSMECLIKGTPQRVRNGAVILAINSWHLYPDLCILSHGPEVVHQRDPLIPSSGILTIDIERSSEVPSSVTWSLPLAYLRYYGEPVVVNRALSVSSARISMDEFRFVLLGCVISTWRGFSDSVMDDIELVTRLLDAIRFPERSDEDSEQQRSNLLRIQRMTGQNSWIGQLLTAADEIASMSPIQRETALKLINHGRRHSRFLCAPEYAPEPLFGLCHIPSLFSLLDGPEPRIRYLRQLAKDLGLSNTNCVIQYYYSKDDYEYATIEPFDGSLGKDNLSGYIRRLNGSNTPAQIRWIPIKTSGLICRCGNTCHRKQAGDADQTPKRGFLRLGRKKTNPEKFCDCLERGGCSIACHGLKVTPTMKCLAETPDLQGRIDYIKSIGEQPMPAYEVPVLSDSQESAVDFGNGEDFDSALLQLSRGDNNNFVTLQFCAGSSHAQILRVGPMTKDSTDPRITGPDGLKTDLGHYFTGKTLKNSMRSDEFNHLKLRDWFENGLWVKDRDFVETLRGCAAAADLYSRLPEATIDSSIVGKTSLRKARWISSDIDSEDEDEDSLWRLTLSRPEAFACIAMFETGQNFDTGYLENVFALTYGNSIFVASPLLADPHEKPLAAEVKRVDGNIGQPGLSFLIPPPNPRIRKSNPSAWTVLSHKQFDGQVEDCFWKTSMHLTLTQYQPGLPGLNQDEHYIDESAALRETLIQVYDRSDWVCDLDILATFENPLVSRVFCRGPTHSSGDFSNTGALSRAITVDNWEELLTPPVDDGVLVIRTSGNWLGRLAAVGICIRLRRDAVILPRRPCWSCVELHLSKLYTIGSSSPVLIL